MIFCVHYSFVFSSTQQNVNVRQFWIRTQVKETCWAHKSSNERSRAALAPCRDLQDFTFGVERLLDERIRGHDCSGNVSLVFDRKTSAPKTNCRPLLMWGRSFTPLSPPTCVQTWNKQFWNHRERFSLFFLCFSGNPEDVWSHMWESDNGTRPSLNQKIIRLNLERGSEFW